MAPKNKKNIPDINSGHNLVVNGQDSPDSEKGLPKQEFLQRREEVVLERIRSPVLKTLLSLLAVSTFSKSALHIPSLSEAMMRT